MELVDILHIVLAIVLVVFFITLSIVGFYIISVLASLKRVLAQAETISFNIAHVRSFAKLGALRSLLKVIEHVKKGGDRYGKSHGYAS